MSWLSDIFAGSGEGLLKGVGEVAKDIREAITGKSILDPNKQAEIELKLLELQNKAEEWQYLMMKAQTDINLEEAKSTNFFVSGWRPSIGWVCSASLAFNFIIMPMGIWVAKFFKFEIAPLTLDMQTLMTILFALLGIGTMRTVEKLKGAQGNH
jgi:hypothetical protein